MSIFGVLLLLLALPIMIIISAATKKKNEEVKKKMKKIINGKRYDTETATLIGSAGYSHSRDFQYWSEELYRKKTGEFFLHGEGGPTSRYSCKIGQNEWSGGEEIRPLSLKEAQKWAEKYLDADEYEQVFGEVEE